MPLIQQPLVEPMEMDQADPANANHAANSPDNLGPNYQVSIGIVCFFFNIGTIFCYFVFNIGIIFCYFVFNIGIIICIFNHVVNIKEVHNPTLDLEAYAGNYTGMGKILRLFYIAEHCPPYRVEALNLAIQYIQDKTHNTHMYQTAFGKLMSAIQDVAEPAPPVPGHPPAPGGRGPDLIPELDERGRGPNAAHFDQQWMEATAKRASCKLEKLDSDLKHYKANSIKESIRRGQDELGEHHLDCGDLQGALKCFSRSRDYCTSTRHILAMCFNVIKVSIYLRNWALVLSYVSRAEGSPEIASAGTPNAPREGSTVRDAFLAKLKVASGLAELANRKFKVAARHFLQVSFTGLEYTEVVSGSNIAAYGTLCALATFDRDELQKAVLGSGEFRQFLELEPWLLELIRQFQESAYGECLQRLETERDNLLLDIYLAPHVPSLLSLIRSKALVQYSSVYLSANLHNMASAFNTDVDRVEEEVMTLILDGQISGRIDSHKKVLHSKEVDVRAAAFHAARATAATLEARANALLLRAALQKAKVCVKAPAKGELGGGGGGGGGPPGTPIPHSPSGPSSTLGNVSGVEAVEASLTPSNSSGHSSPSHP